MNFSAISLTDPTGGSSIADGVAWIEGAALGTSATVIAVIAVAAIGLMMLAGRLELKRGITVVLGCFILFGASGIAAAITGLAGARTERALISRPADPLASPLQHAEPSPTAYDPYAGASVPDVRRP